MNQDKQHKTGQAHLQRTETAAEACALLTVLPVISWGPSPDGLRMILALRLGLPPRPRNHPFQSLKNWESWLRPLKGFRGAGLTKLAGKHLRVLCKLVVHVFWRPSSENSDPPEKDRPKYHSRSPTITPRPPPPRYQPKDP